MASESRRGRVGIREVADAAGVSPTTVSHALNGQGRVSSGTAAHVEAVAERLGYRPSRTARSLRTAQTETLALLLPDFETSVEIGLPTTMLDYYMRLVHSATLTAFKFGYRLLMAMPVSSTAEAAAMGVDGALICDPIAGDPQIDYFLEAGLPVVTHEKPPDRPGFHWHVNADNEAVTEELLDHLLAAGAVRVAMVIPDIPSPGMFEVRHAYLGWCKARGREPMLQTIAPWRAPSAGSEQVEQLLSAPQRPDAIVDAVAPASLQACQRLGLKVPEDVLIATLLDTPEARYADPPLTAVSIDEAAIGRAAIELLVGLTEKRSPQGPVIVDSRIVPRQSTRRQVPPPA